MDGKPGVKIATARGDGSGDPKEAQGARWERTRHTAADSHAACNTLQIKRSRIDSNDHLA